MKLSLNEKKKQTEILRKKKETKHFILQNLEY